MKQIRKVRFTPNLLTQPSSQPLPNKSRPNLIYHPVTKQQNSNPSQDPPTSLPTSHKDIQEPSFIKPTLYSDHLGSSKTHLDQTGINLLHLETEQKSTSATIKLCRTSSYQQLPTFYAPTKLSVDKSYLKTEPSNPLTPLFRYLSKCRNKEQQISEQIKSLLLYKAKEKTIKKQPQSFGSIQVIKAPKKQNIYRFNKQILSRLKQQEEEQGQGQNTKIWNREYKPQSRTMVLEELSYLNNSKEQRSKQRLKKLSPLTLNKSRMFENISVPRLAKERIPKLKAFTHKNDISCHIQR